MDGPINLGKKQAGKRSAGNPHATFDRAGAGNGTARLPRQPSTLPLTIQSCEMRITSKDTIAGMPAIKVRDALKHLRDCIWTLDTLAAYLKVDSEQGSSVIEALQKLGYIAPNAHSSGRGEWEVTNGGVRFINATAAKPITRKTADKLVREFLSRVDEVNRTPYYLYRVRKVLVFGSYLTKTYNLGDIDLAVEFEPKESNKERQRTLEDERIRHAFEAGRHFSNHTEQLFWPCREVQMFLKKRSRALNLHGSDDGVLKMTQTKTLFHFSK